MFNTVGLIQVALMLYKASALLQLEQQQWMVLLIYLLIQGVEASVALLSGYAYDKFEVRVFTLPLFSRCFR